MSQYIAPSLDVNCDPAGFVIDLDSLAAYLARLHDPRHACGLRYSLVTLLLFVVLAKLAGQDELAGIADWVRHREQPLAEALHLKRPRSPCLNTYRRVLGELIDLDEFEALVHDFFAALPQAGQSIVIALDGKTLRGTIPTGHSHGVHLLAAYLPAEGWVLLQVEVKNKANEITAAPRLLKSLDLRGKVVTGDALLAQRALSLQIVEAGGDYLWTIKQNQAGIYQQLQQFFTPPAGMSFNPAAPDGVRTARSFDKGHGRWEWRTLRATRVYPGHLHWPQAAQAFQVERRFVRVADGHETYQVVFGVTSLTVEEASAKRLLELQRSHWGIENGLHYRRDETLREDWYQLKKGHTAHAMALLNNLVLGLILHRGEHNVPRARRHYEAHLQDSVHLALNRLSSEN
jgi:predicted transposase YbfD/YdcC